MSKLTTLITALVLLVLASTAPAQAQEGGSPDAGAAVDGTFVVGSGETLSSIAGKLYGDTERWKLLFEANRDRVGDPDLIFPGQVLLVPLEQSPIPAAAPEPIAETPAAETEQAAGSAGGAAANQYEQPTTDASQQEEAAPAPSGNAMSLNVPALGLSSIPVIDENSEAALTAGAMHLPGTGFPWQGEGSNTYVAGHRVGYPGTPSDRVFYDLPSLQEGDEVVLTDADGRDYTYAVTEMFAVSPSDTWVTSPVAGRDVVTLQTCTETVDDWTTIGPRLMSSGPESGRLIVRADRVS